MTGIMLPLYLMARVYCFALQYTGVACHLVGCETTLNSSAGMQRRNNEYNMYDKVETQVTSVTGSTD